MNTDNYLPFPAEPRKEHRRSIFGNITARKDLFAQLFVARGLTGIEYLHGETRCRYVLVLAYRWELWRIVRLN